MADIKAFLLPPVMDETKEVVITRELWMWMKMENRFRLSFV